MRAAPVALALTLLALGTWLAPEARAETPAPAMAAASGAASVSPLGHATVAEALAALEARDGQGTIVTHADGWTIINEPLASAQWSFTPPTHPAHPAVVRRVIRRGADGSTRVETQHLCESPEAACTQLLAEFQAMNDRITQAVKARGRQGSTQGPRP